MRYILPCLFLFLLGQRLYAQVPPAKFRYSATARDSQNNPLADSTADVQVSIHQTSAAGTLFYRENHTVETSLSGSFSIVIGDGSVQYGQLDTVPWQHGNYFMSISLDPTATGTFPTALSSQLLSVPYAMYTASADSIAGGVTETDPVFDGSVAAAIGQDHIDRWNADADSTNELQLLSMHADTLFLSNGGFVRLPNRTIGSLSVPVLHTYPVTGVTSNGCTYKGNISNIDTTQLLECGFVFSANAHPTVAALRYNFGNTSGDLDTTTEYLYNPSHILNPNTVYYVRTYAKVHGGYVFYGNEVSFTTSAIGQTGPGGGIVFFSKQQPSDGWQFMEAAPSDQSTGKRWGCVGDTISLTSMKMGKGKNNTLLIVSECSDTDIAATLCNDLVLNGQSDWFLPSTEELYMMKFNLHAHGLGGFGNAMYWSSKDLYLPGFSTVHFWVGSSTLTKNSLFRVRAARSY